MFVNGMFIYVHALFITQFNDVHVHRKRDPGPADVQHDAGRTGVYGRCVEGTRAVTKTRKRTERVEPRGA